MNISHGVLMGIVGTLVVLAIVNRVEALAPVSSVIKTITA